MPFYRQKFIAALGASLLSVLLIFFVTGLVRADTFSDLRVQVGLKLFRTLVNADLDITEKTNANNELEILLVYGDDQSNVEELQQQLQKEFSTLNTLPVSIGAVALDALLKSSERMPAALFICQTLTNLERDALLQYSNAHHIILFSPFKGDVEKGVLGGISVQATVRPLINMQTLATSGINIKPFYLKVAKRYE